MLPPTPETRLRPFLIRQEGIVTTAQALSANVTPRELLTLKAKGWAHPHRGIYVAPEPSDPFRSSLRAAQLAYPAGVGSETTAARVHGLWGLPLWTPEEKPQLIALKSKTPAQRRGARTRYGLLPEDRVVVDGFPVASLGRTVANMSSVLRLDDLVCLVDSALRLGWDVEKSPHQARGAARLREALTLANPLSESAFETLLRLLFLRAGLYPEVLQFRLFSRDGVCYARLDFAWPSRRLGVEADGRETHDTPGAFQNDRVRDNLTSADKWTVLRYTWHDFWTRPAFLTGQVRHLYDTLPIVGNVR